MQSFSSIADMGGELVVMTSILFATECEKERKKFFKKLLEVVKSRSNLALYQHIYWNECYMILLSTIKKFLSFSYVNARSS